MARRRISTSGRAGTQGRSTKTKSAVLGLRERKSKVKATVIAKADMVTSHKIVKDCVLDGSRIYTDDARHWTKGVIGYKHNVVNHSVKEFVNERWCIPTA